MLKIEQKDVLNQIEINFKNVLNKIVFYNLIILLVYIKIDNTPPLNYLHIQ